MGGGRGLDACLLEGYFLVNEVIIGFFEGGDGVDPVVQEVLACLGHSGTDMVYGVAVVAETKGYALVVCLAEEPGGGVGGFESFSVSGGIYVEYCVVFFDNLQGLCCGVLDGLVGDGFLVGCVAADEVEVADDFGLELLNHLGDGLIVFDGEFFDAAAVLYGGLVGFWGVVDAVAFYVVYGADDKVEFVLFAVVLHNLGIVVGWNDFGFESAEYGELVCEFFGEAFALLGVSGESFFEFVDVPAKFKFFGVEPLLPLTWGVFGDGEGVVSGGDGSVEDIFEGIVGVFAECLAVSAV